MSTLNPWQLSDHPDLVARYRVSIQQSEDRKASVFAECILELVRVALYGNRVTHAFDPAVGVGKVAHELLHKDGMVSMERYPLTFEILWKAFLSGWQAAEEVSHDPDFPPENFFLDALVEMPKRWGSPIVKSAAEKLTEHLADDATKTMFLKIARYFIRGKLGPSDKITTAMKVGLAHSATKEQIEVMATSVQLAASSGYSPDVITLALPLMFQASKEVMDWASMAIELKHHLGDADHSLTIEPFGRTAIYTRTFMHPGLTAETPASDKWVRSSGRSLISKADQAATWLRFRLKPLHSFQATIVYRIYSLPQRSDPVFIWERAVPLE